MLSTSKRRKCKQQWQVKQPSWLELTSDLMAIVSSRVAVGVHNILDKALKVCNACRKFCKEPRNWLKLPYDVMINILSRVGLCNITENVQKVCNIAWRKIWKEPTRNWLDLPSDVTVNILSRVSVHDLLENAQKVCTVWRKICKDPSMWRVICMDYSYLNSIYKDRSMCKHAVDRSQGQLIDITIGVFGDDELLQYVADRSSQLRRLKIISCNSSSYRSWTEVLKKFPLLEELSLYSKQISNEVVEAVGCYCPLLKTLKLNEGAGTFLGGYIDSCDKIATTIGENLHELEHLELIGNNMSNIGLQVILDGCRHLKSLDLRTCWFIDVEGDLGKRCSQQIKCLKLPDDSLEGCQYIYGYDSNLLDDSDDEYDYFGLDDYTKFDDLNEMLFELSGFSI